MVDGTTHNVTAWIHLGDLHYAIAFDSSNGYLYLTNHQGTVDVVDGATNQWIGSIPVYAGGGGGIAFDSSNCYLYAVNQYSNNVSVIDGATDSLVGSVSIPSSGFPFPSPWGIAFDSSNGDLYVTDSGAYPHGNVTVIDTATNNVVKTIAVGFVPTGVAVDGSSGEVFVTNSYGNNVTVIDGATNTVVGSIPVGGAPYGVTFDSSNGEVYVTDWIGGPGIYGTKVTVIDGATNKVVGSIPVGLYPRGIAFDNSTGELYVADWYTDQITVIDGYTNNAVDSIDLGGVARGVVYDSSNGNLYVVDDVSGLLFAISGTTNKVIASIPLWATDSADALAFDTTNGDVYALTCCDPLSRTSSSNVTVIDGTTNQVVRTIPLPGGSPNAIAFDNSNGYLYVAQSTSFGPYANSDNVTVIDGTTNQVIDSITLPNGSLPVALAYDSSNHDVYVADAEVATATGFAGNTTVIDGGTNSIVSEIQTVGCGGGGPEGIALDSSNGYLYVTMSGSDCMTVINGATNQVVDTIGVGNVTFAVTFDASNGYVYASRDSESTFVIDGATDQVVGSIGVIGYGIAYDSSNRFLYETQNYPDTVSIIAAQPPLSASATTSRSNADVGQLIAFTCMVAGGVSPYQYSWAFDDGTNATGAGVTHAFSSAGAHVGVCAIIDSTGSTTTTSVIVTVSSDPQVSRPSASPQSADVGQTVTFTVVTTGGSGGDHFAWSGLPTGCSPSDLANVRCTPSSPGNSTVAVRVSDSNGFSVQSATLAYRIDSSLLVILVSSPSTVNSGETFLLTATASGGSSGYAYVYSGLPPGCPSVDSSSIRCTTQSPGTYSIHVTASDTNGLSVTSPVTMVTVQQRTVLGLPQAEGAALALSGIGVAAITAILLAVIVLRRRRKRTRDAIIVPKPEDPA